jgi:phosphoribosyl-AMP cyclohydrolase / phosphoribosyl-ATP pyrophosphohydrolase
MDAINLDFKKGDGLIPAIIQDDRTAKVLMLGYMNVEAFEQTKSTGNVVFYSRSKERLWMKGETSGNILSVRSIQEDCDKDCILIKVVPAGPVCHTGAENCFNDGTKKGYLYALEKRIADRIDFDVDDSYTNKLYRSGMNKMAQKVGEEAVELVIEAKDDNEVLFKEEASDLLYHMLILLKAKGVSLEDIEEVLYERAISK